MTMDAVRGGRGLPLGLVASVAGFAIAATATADQFTMTFAGLGPSRVIGLNYNSARAFNAAKVTTYASVQAGLLRWNTGWGERGTFCTQLSETVSGGLTVTYDVVDATQVPDADPAPGPMGAVKSALVHELVGRFYDAVRSSNDNTLHAAFQLAIWEITHENLTATNAHAAASQLSLTLGAVQSQSANASTVSAAATSMLAMLAGADDGSWDDGRLVGLTHATAQDQLMVVPLPAVAGLAACGLLSAWTIRRRMSA